MSTGAGKSSAGAGLKGGGGMGQENAGTDQALEVPTISYPTIQINSDLYLPCTLERYGPFPFSCFKILFFILYW